MSTSPAPDPLLWTPLLAVPSPQPGVSVLSNKKRTLVLIQDLYRLAQLDEDILNQFDGALYTAYMGIHDSLATLDTNTDCLAFSGFM